VATILSYALVLLLVLSVDRGSEAGKERSSSARGLAGGWGDLPGVKYRHGIALSTDWASGLKEG
jgi:hypothetical protein